MSSPLSIGGGLLPGTCICGCWVHRVAIWEKKHRKAAQLDSDYSGHCSLRFGRGSAGGAWGGMDTNFVSHAAHLMAMFSVVIACSGLFMSYSRRATAIWVAAGGLVLALFWWVNRILV